MSAQKKSTPGGTLLFQQGKQALWFVCRALGQPSQTAHFSSGVVAMQQALGNRLVQPPLCLTHQVLRPFFGMDQRGLRFFEQGAKFAFLHFVDSRFACSRPRAFDRRSNIRHEFTSLH